ncbi:hypothetical protein [Streptacidiphilus sp. EB129]|uniref:hypothetical protein n=1 Tax=Streptacidiphilus sp. EB129 TaxID=3156262 RepID=UPI0035158BC7
MIHSPTASSEVAPASTAHAVSARKTGQRAPDAVVITGTDQDGVSAWLHDGDRSWAALSATGDGTAALRQGGPLRIGDETLTAWDQWEEHGRPVPYDYGMTVTPAGQWAWLNDPATGPRWPVIPLTTAGREPRIPSRHRSHR